MWPTPYIPQILCASSSLNVILDILLLQICIFYFNIRLITFQIIIIVFPYLSLNNISKKGVSTKKFWILQSGSSTLCEFSLVNTKIPEIKIRIVSFIRIYFLLFSVYTINKYAFLLDCFAHSVCVLWDIRKINQLEIWTVKLFRVSISTQVNIH